MKVYKNFMELVGNTPLVQINNYMKANDLKANILVKLNILILQAVLKTGLREQ